MRGANPAIGRFYDLMTECGNDRRGGWIASFELEREREQPGKERNGWSVTVHDLSGSPMVLASMVTPFVASSHDGSGELLQPGAGGASSDALGYRFELLLPDTSMSVGIPLAEFSLSSAAFVAFPLAESSSTPLEQLHDNNHL
uniref:Uncharacterized protein n=1 Tax=Ananas comosus var. bracteatus TaxID=296719 RepID=A0A6V7PRU5_ANACO|nr:unnamed protein product [Ananas comosus var. bracteatus]